METAFWSPVTAEMGRSVALMFVGGAVLLGVIEAGIRLVKHLARR